MSFDEATTVVGGPLATTVEDPGQSLVEIAKCFAVEEIELPVDLGDRLAIGNSRLLQPLEAGDLLLEVGNMVPDLRAPTPRL